MMQESDSTENLIDEDDDVELTGCGATLACDPKRRLHRYLVLILICFLSFGSYFCYDNPAALEDIITSDMNLQAQAYMSFYSWYSWPNVVLSFVGGFLIDRVFGIRLGSIIFGLFVLAGQILFAAGAYVNMYWLCVLGRFTFGVGGESLAVTQNTYASAWFDDSELNFIFGLQLSISRIGSTVNMNTMSRLYNALPLRKYPYQTLGLALFIAALTCVFSMICALMLAWYDKRAARILKRKKVIDEDKIALSDIPRFPMSFWLICGICVAYYVAVFPFVSLSKVFLIQKFGKDGNSAAFVTSMLYIISAAASPVSGFLIDFTGRNLFWVLAGTAMTLGCHGLFAFTFLDPIVTMILMGIAYSVLASSLWPMVALIIPLNQRGTAFGIMQSVQNLGLACIALLAGFIQDRFGFFMLEVFFSVCLCLTIFLIVVLYLWDQQNGVRLNESGSSRRNKLSKSEVIVSQSIIT